MIERLATSSDPEADLARSGLRPSPWSASPRTVFPPHRHPATKRLFVLEGSITFRDLDGGGTSLSLRRGEGIRIPAGTEHDAVAGDAGVRCVEAFEEDR